MKEITSDEAKKLSDEELDREMERIYGSDWSFEVLSPPKEPVAK